MDYGRLAIMLAGPRRSGRSTRLIQSAPIDSTILTVNVCSRRHLQVLADHCHRRDLKIVSMEQLAELRGIARPVLPDHFAVEHWLMSAQIEINRLAAENAELKAKLPLEDN